MQHHWWAAAVASAAILAPVSVFDAHAQQTGAGGAQGGGMSGFSSSFSTGGPGFSHFSWFGPGAGQTGGCFMMSGENGAFPSLEARLAFIAESIGLTPQQQPQWANFSAALKRSIETQQAAFQTMMSTMMSLNFVERFNAQLGAMNTHLANLQQVMPALQQVYAVLTPEQRTKADQLFRSMGCFW